MQYRTFALYGNYLCTSTMKICEFVNLWEDQLENGPRVAGHDADVGTIAVNLQEQYTINQLSLSTKIARITVIRYYMKVQVKVST